MALLWLMKPDIPSLELAARDARGLAIDTVARCKSGQGVSSAVGYAVSAKMGEARSSTAGHTIFNHLAIALAGDGFLQEDMSHD